MKIIACVDRHIAEVDALWRTCFSDEPLPNGVQAGIPAKLVLADYLLLAGKSDWNSVIGAVRGEHKALEVHGKADSWGAEGG